MTGEGTEKAPQSAGQIVKNALRRHELRKLVSQTESNNAENGTLSAINTRRVGIAARARRIVSMAGRRRSLERIAV